MPSPKDCKSPEIVAPTKPTAPYAADDSSPGEVEKLKQVQREKGEGKYGSQKVNGHKKDEENEDKTHWIEVELIDESDAPVSGETVSIKLPDGSVAEGSTDETGLFRVECIDPGSCEISFPKLDSEAWEPA